MSVNVVDKSTGNVTRVAGNANDSGIGNLDSLTTRNKSSLVAAINEVNSDDGDSIFEGTQQEWNDLSTAEKTAYDFAAITDDYTPGAIGNLNSLTTTDKSSIVGAINELNSDKKDEYTSITYAQWQQLTPAQQAAKDYYISDYPSSVITAGNVSYNNSSSGMSADDVQEAVDELKSGLTDVQRNMTNVLTGSDAMQSDHNVHEAVLTRNGMIYVGFFNMTLTSAVSAWTPFAHVEANLKYITLCNGAYGGANSSYCMKNGDMILTQQADAGTQMHIVLVGVADFT